MILSMYSLSATIQAIPSLMEAESGKHVHKVLFIKMIKMLLPMVA